MKQSIQGGRVLTVGRLDGVHADLLIDGDTIVALVPPGASVTADAIAPARKRSHRVNCRVGM